MQVRSTAGHCPKALLPALAEPAALSWLFHPVALRPFRPTQEQTNVDMWAQLSSPGEHSTACNGGVSSQLHLKLHTNYSAYYLSGSLLHSCFPSAIGFSLAMPQRISRRRLHMPFAKGTLMATLAPNGYLPLAKPFVFLPCPHSHLSSPAFAWIVTVPFLCSPWLPIGLIKIKPEQNSNRWSLFYSSYSFLSLLSITTSHTIRLFSQLSSASTITANGVQASSHHWAALDINPFNWALSRDTLG